MILRRDYLLGNKAMAVEIGVHEQTIGKWRRCFFKECIDGLSDEPRPGRPRAIRQQQVAELIERPQTTPLKSATMARPSRCANRIAGGLHSAGIGNLLCN